MSVCFAARSTVQGEEILSVINYYLLDHSWKNIFKELTTKLKYGKFPSRFKQILSHTVENWEVKSQK